MAVWILFEFSFQLELRLIVSQRRTAFTVFRLVDAGLKRENSVGKPISAVAQFFAVLQ